MRSAARGRAAGHAGGQRVWRIAVLAVIAAALLPVGESRAAVTVAFTGSPVKLVVTGTGQTDEVTIRENPQLGTLSFRDPAGVTIDPSARVLCVSAAFDLASCDRNQRDALVDVGDGDDAVTMVDTNGAPQTQTPVSVLGGFGDDELTGSLYAETLDGGPGTDLLTPGAGADVVSCGEGIADVVSYDDGRATGVTVNLANAVQSSADGDTLAGCEGVIGTPGNDSLTGNGEANVLSGLGGTDGLAGSGGNDVLVGGPGADVTTCGDGVDEISYDDGRMVGVTVDLAAGSVPQPLADGDNLLGGVTCENLTGSAGSDDLRGSGTENLIRGLEGSDTITARDGSDTILPGQGADGLVDGGPGGDLVSYLDGRTAGVEVDLSDPDDDDGDPGERLMNIERVTGTNADDVLIGGPGDETLDGMAGNDDLRPGAGADKAVGGAGDEDLLRCSDVPRPAGVTIELTIVGPGCDPEELITEIEWLEGTDGPDRLTGDGGANLLRGLGGADILEGGNGEDALIGGAGPDDLRAVDSAADVLSCGTELDLYAADALDLLTFDCEPPDRDGDGSGDTADCGPDDPAIRPGATEVAGNAVDEDCDGVAAPAAVAPVDPPLQGGTPAPAPASPPPPAIVPAGSAPAAAKPVVGSRVDLRARAGRRSTRLTRLTVSRLPARARVVVTCVRRAERRLPRNRRSCAFASRTTRLTRATASRSLLAPFARRALRPGTVIEVRVTAPGLRGIVVRYVVRTGRAPRRSSSTTP